jgi:hypothetical protein
MSLDYCCFISYPHGQEDVLRPLVSDFVQGLEREVYALTRKRVWIDYKRLEGGHQLDEEIGSKICKSACMILLYTPLYFDTEHTYCAQELKAMHDLECKRLAFLREKGRGLIIPVVLRGEKKIPPMLSKRVYYNFTNIEFNNPNDIIHVKYSKQLRQIADYLAEQSEILDKVIDEIPHDCETFRLPSSEEAQEFVETVLEGKISKIAVPFVVRGDISPS